MKWALYVSAQDSTGPTTELEKKKPLPDRTTPSPLQWQWASFFLNCGLFHNLYLLPPFPVLQRSSLMKILPRYSFLKNRVHLIQIFETHVHFIQFLETPRTLYTVSWNTAYTLYSFLTAYTLYSFLKQHRVHFIQLPAYILYSFLKQHRVHFIQFPEYILYSFWKYRLHFIRVFFLRLFAFEPFIYFFVLKFWWPAFPTF